MKLIKSLSSMTQGDKKTRLYTFLTGLGLLVIILGLVLGLTYWLKQRKAEEQKAFESFVQAKQQEEINAVYKSLSEANVQPPTAEQLTAVYKSLQSASTTAPTPEELGAVYESLRAAEAEKRDKLYEEFKNQ